MKINIIKTDTGICFISDCTATSGYDYNYHRPKINEFFFDGEKPTPTYYPNWFQIKLFPNKIQYLKNNGNTNCRYELIDPAMESEKLPKTISYEQRDTCTESVRDCLYEYKSDRVPDTLEDVDCELVVLCELKNFKEAPTFNYSGIHRHDYKEEIYKITNKNIEHSLIDKIITPSPALHYAACRLSSKEVYDIVRQFIREKIDLSVAKITSDYDFCFTVKKTIPLIEPETITYHNYFARTKRERDKIRYTTKKYDEKEIFQMTHTQSNYQGYTPIKAIEANNEWELKEKIDAFLNDLISVINKPLKKCPHCIGGYVEGENGEQS